MIEEGPITKAFYNLVGNTGSGYCVGPVTFESMSAAKNYGDKMKNDSRWVDYRITLFKKLI